MTTIEPCEFLRWDTEFFGYRIARVVEHRLTPQQVRAISSWCEAHRIECVYFLADSDHAETVRLAESDGFRLVDIRVTLQCSIGDWRAKSTRRSCQHVVVRSWRETDLPVLQSIARASYSDSRFYFDPYFPAEKCKALYETWIKRSCEGYADVVFVAELNGEPAGYVSCHLNSVMSDKIPGGQIGLVGVEPRAQGQGVGRALIERSIEWFAEQGVEVVNVVTQGRNIAAQRLYQRCGFLTHSLRLWYHKWMIDLAAEGI